MSAADIESLLDAGAILPKSTKVPKGQPVDEVEARAYQHPAFGDAPVVRLVASNQAQGTDLEMGLLGFGDGKAVAKIGRRRRQALGFPGWALVHDPKNAKYALEVVKEFKRHIRRAKSKPGHAKDGIDAIGKKLGRSVPQFLPSFYEEAGRGFIVFGNLNYAATCFGKAREAEGVHALKVDEDHRRESFLEFALAGAVTNKSLADYAKELGASNKPDLAYQHFRELCVKRTLGGMPPWASMAKELRKLCKGAGLDRKVEDEKLLNEILESPALSKASPEFWKSYRKELIGLAKGSAQTRGRLLNLFPTPSQEKKGFHGTWLQFLDDCGALEGLAQAEPKQARPSEGTAAWFTKLTAHVQRGWRRSAIPVEVFALLRRFKDRLIADGDPVTFTNSYRQLSLDLVDLALELKVPVADPDEHRLELRTWAQRAKEHGEHGRDPIFVSKDPRFEGLIRGAFNQSVGTKPFTELTEGKQGFLDIKRDWLLSLISDAKNGALPSLRDSVRRLTDATSATTFREVEGAYAELKEIDPAACLVRTLQGGIFPELGWPDYEAAMQELSSDKSYARTRGTFPYGVVHNHQKAIAIGPKGRVGEHEFQIPATSEVIALRYCQGQFLVCFVVKYEAHAYWSGNPKETFVVGDRWSLARSEGRGVELPDGSITEGGRAYAAGDTELILGGNVISDGETFWTLDRSRQPWRMREYDPKTGDKGRSSLPKWIEDYAADGKVIDRGISYVLPLPEGLKDSPLGSRDGLVGWRSRYDVGTHGRGRSSGRQAEAIDGRSVEGFYSGRAPNLLIQFPHIDQPQPVVCVVNNYNRQMTVTICDHKTKIAVTDHNKAEDYFLVTPAVSPGLWHYFQPRDPDGSKALRSVSAKSARALLDAANKDRKAEKGDTKWAHVTEAVKSDLAGVTDDRLRLGVARIAWLARHHEGLLGELLAARDPESAEAAGSAGESIQGTELQNALAAFAPRGSAAGDVAVDLLQMLAHFRREERGANEERQLPPSASKTGIWLSSIEIAAFVASSSFTSDDARKTLLRFLKLVVATRVLEDKDKLRFYEGIVGEADRKAETRIVSRSGNDYLLRGV